MKIKKPTYEQLILKLLESNPLRWWFSYELVSRWVEDDRIMPHGKGWLGPSADRIARYMSEEGKIERKGRKEHNGKYALYRAKPTPSGQVINVKQMAFNKELW